jgi:hypothetical protein
MTGWLLMAALWWDPLCCVVLNRLIGHVSGSTIMSLARTFFLVEQPITWAFFAALLIFLTHFAQRQWRVLTKR